MTRPNHDPRPLAFLLTEKLVRFLVRIVVLVVYRMKVIGAEKLPDGGGVIIANHVSYLDAVLLQLASPRRIHFMGLADLEGRRWLMWTFRIFGVIPVSSRRAKTALATASAKLAAGDWVCIFPEGQVTRTGAMNELKEGFAVMAQRARVPVIPVYIDGLWGSVFSFYGGKFFWKLPRYLPYPVSVRFGRPVPYQEASVDRARREFSELSEQAFSDRPEMKRHVGRECVRALSRRPGKTAIIDHTAARREISRGKLFAVSATLSRRIRKTISDRRVGIVLPPGIAGTIANLAVLLAGKTPVNLNFTAGRAAVESSLAQAGIQTVITAAAMKSKVGDFPWPEKTLDLVEEIQGCGRAAILCWLAAVRTLPAAVLSRVLRVPRKGGREEAGLLFTSGSSGAPKGVVLTHRNIIGNVEQMLETGVITRDDTLLASLPLFHSFGFTVTLWCALLKGVRIASVPSPLEGKKIAGVIEEEKVTVHVGAPTFLRGLLKRADEHQLRSLRLIVSGAEKLPPELHEGFRERFGVPVFQGYGLTETSPVVSVNLPDPAKPGNARFAQRGAVAESVGRLLPGISARIVDPETGRDIPLVETGILQIKGPNVFSGYLNEDEKTRECFDGEWFVTGDLARFDADGFLFIEGRLSRFSKLGGEMVPHGRVEEAILDTFDLKGAEEPVVFVGGVPDSEKGEALVLLTSVNIDPSELRSRLTETGLPKLWIPRRIVPVERIPILGSGKLDLKHCLRIAEEATATVPKSSPGKCIHRTVLA